MQEDQAASKLLFVQLLTLLPLLGVGFFGNAVAAELLYLWSRYFPTAQVNIFWTGPLSGFLSALCAAGIGRAAQK